MSTAHAQAVPGEGAGFRHEALFYAGTAEFVARCAAFVRTGVAAGEPTLVVVSAEKIRKLRSALADAAGRVVFADMAEVGTNPARIIPVWRRFVADHADAGTRLRGIGEPVWPERSCDELVECQLHESLLNIAFADARDFWLACPYDVESLPEAVLAEARRSHPYVDEDGAPEASAPFAGTDAFAAPLSEPLREPPPDAAQVSVGAETLAALRRFVFEHAEAAGLEAAAAGDMILAVHELAANSVRYGGGAATVLAWQEPDALVCEVRDGGYIDDPLAGRAEPVDVAEGGRGLWLVNQLCDLAQVRSAPGATVVRVRKRRA